MRPDNDGKTDVGKRDSSGHGNKPLSTGNKSDVLLTPGMSIGQAMAAALMFHLEAMENNLPGLKADLDTAFLHDFRIACRRSRTLITQVKNVIPGEREKYYREVFAWLSNKTSEHRDLDVFLLDIPEYQAMLPEVIREGIGPLREEIAGRRLRAHNRLLKLLASVKFNKFRSEYRKYLKSGVSDHFGTETGERPVIMVANKVIWRVYKRLLRQGRQAVERGDQESLHKLRKTEKKLRYLLETFRSLYPEKDIDRVISRCKKLQNSLGRTIDFRIQQNYLTGLAGNPNLPESTNRCISYLVDSYKKTAVEKTEGFDGHFAWFSRQESGKLFDKLFRKDN